MSPTKGMSHYNEMGTDRVIRPEIAAKQRGPGPARYVLPSQTGQLRHDPTRSISPAYSFGKRLGSSLVRPWSSPGPVHAFPASLTRTGKGGTPAYTLRPRINPLRPATTPGPSAYRPEQGRVLSSKRSPQYSFGTRHRELRPSATPAPNTYQIKTTIGRENALHLKGPAYSLTGRSLSGSFAEDIAHTPGPAAYQCERSDRFLRQSLSYSMLARNFGVEAKAPAPSPGTYSPERCRSGFKSSPETSFGVKHSDYLTPFIDSHTQFTQ